MRRSILCEPCVQAYQAVGPAGNRRVKEGALRVDAHCDSCNTDLSAGTDAYATTEWEEGHGQPYFPWESEMLELPDPPIPVSPDAMARIVEKTKEVIDQHGTQSIFAKKYGVHYDIVIAVAKEAYGIGWWDANRAIQNAIGDTYEKWAAAEEQADG